MTLPLRNRIKKQKDFEEVFTQGKTVKGSFFLCRGLSRPGKPFRFAPVVPSKVSPRAVVRNRIKRRLMGAVQGLLSPLPVGFDIVIVVQRLFEGTDEDLNKELEKVFQALKLL